MVVMPKQNVPALRLGGFEGEWETTSIGTVSTLHNGRDYKHLGEGCIPVYGTGGYMVSVDQALSHDKDAVGIGRKGTINKPYILKAPFWTVDTLFYVVPNQDTDLAFFYASVLQVDWMAKNTATGLPSLTSQAINSADISVPHTLEEQQAIGAIFTNLDAAINQHTLKHKALQQSKTALMQRMFPQEGQTVPELRLEGFSGEWETEAVGAFSRLLPHNCLSREQLTDLDTGVSNVHYGDILVKLTAVTTPDGLPFAKDATQFQHLTGHFLNDGDVVFADAAEDLTVGKCTEVQDIGNKKVVAGLHTIPIHPIRSFGKAFLGYAFNADSFHNRLIPRVQGTKVSSISARTLLETELSIPPTPEEQQAIGAVFTNLDQLIAAEDKYIASLKQAKTALLQRMFI